MHKNPDGSYKEEDIDYFKKAVKDFLHTLRECNPGAQIIWCYGMLGIPFQKPICQAVYEYVDETQDRKVSYLQLPDTDTDSTGSRQHPGYLSHQRAAKVLSEFIRTLV